MRSADSKEYRQLLPRAGHYHCESRSEHFSERFNWRAIVRIDLICTLLFIALLAPATAYSADVVLIRSAATPTPEQNELEIAVQFYGLSMKVLTIEARNTSSAFAIASQRDTMAVAIDANALAAINRNLLLRALHRKDGSNVPLLIFGVTPQTDTRLLSSISNNAVADVKDLNEPSQLNYVVRRVPRVTRQLSDVGLPFPNQHTSYFVLSARSSAREVLAVESQSITVPTFIEATLKQQEVFLLCKMVPRVDADSDWDASKVVNAFATVAPLMMFVKYSAGERGWHSPTYYANFTIDDPWLRESYGYVDYHNLLMEMEKHDFHTTIAFIPWNYERSDPAVVSLFRSHPDRFSIAIHGNDHDHKEFTNYQNKPLSAQVNDIKQSLARMDRFQVLTGIPYDKVMIFPHSIAPEQTLGALKTYNFAATVNSSNVPQNSISTKNLPENLRPVTLSFEGFPSISRYSTEAPVPKAYLAINEFLGNPLLFYDHSDLFSKGIGAFDHVADEVNRLEPDTKWRSLGEIVKHLYVVKIRNDSNFDVMAFSNNICLENTAVHNAIFYVQKREIGGQKLGSVTVNGEAYPYSLQGDQMNLNLAVPSGGTSCVAIQYMNDLQLGSIDLRHDSVVVYLLRMASDFRDIYLSKSSLGLVAIRFYNEHELKPMEVIGCLLFMISALSYLGYRLFVFFKGNPSSIRSRPYRLSD